MRKIALLLIVFVVLVSCASKAPKKAENPVDLYVAGVDLMKAKKYEKAIAKFNAIREQYPFDPMALVATVKLGDTYFLKKDYVLASGTYEDYFKAHPDEENIPYVLFRLSECYEKLSPSVDRDQAYTIKGIERITYLKNRYPASNYAREAQPRLEKFIQKLADRELYVGEFYFKTAQYNGAIIRLEGMLKQFPDSKNTAKALFYLVQSHRELGNQDKSDRYLERLRIEYPKSIYARTTTRERKSLKIVPVDEKPSKTGVGTPAPQAAQPEKTAPSDKPQAPPAYTEQKKRDIDLKPPAPQAAQPEKTAPSDKPQAPQTAKASPVETTKPLAPKTETAKATPADTSSKQPGQDKPKAKEGLGFIDKKKPIDIVSDTMEGFDKENYVVFKGNVIAKQDDLYIYSDTMEAFMNADTNEIEKANAKGNVKIIKQNRTATCREAFFDNNQGEIILTGNAVVTSGKDRVEGDVVTYYVNEDLAIVDGDKSKKAKVTIYPKK
ncbi:MAG TPA: lipopolysaccharide transport periplasmic protein LptA [Syntrophorhabdaceae bacterium]|nr:lipopolysaccharide transport periplasmic protein LptA [Syntrophorhabdaceae bacterium]